MIKRIQVFLWILAIFAFMFSLNSDALARENNPTGKNNRTIAKPSVDKVTQSLINIGNWGYWFVNDGMIGHSPYTGDAGGFYPRGTAGAVYREGLVWGGIVDDPTASVKLRVGGNTYNVGTQPGAFNMDPGDDRARVYRIRSDWRTLTAAQVVADAGEYFNVDPSAVTSAHTTEIIDSYKLDWKEWPTDLGAPYYDVDGDGTYNPVLDPDGMPVAGTLVLEDGTEIVGNDYPGLGNADQVLWMVTNDQNEGRTSQLYGSPPMGIECQVTGWAYNQPTAGLGQIVFKKFKFYNYSGFTIDSMYVAQWCDPDLGNYGDDLTGCDTSLSLMYAYNGYPVDGQYADFGLAPAAVGYDFFQGPIVPSPGDTAVFDLKKVPDYRNLPMTSFGYFGAGTDYTDPPLQDYDGTLQWYNLLRGFGATTEVDNPTPWTVQAGPDAGETTLFPLSGDPVTGEGDIDGVAYQPGDRRMLQCSGPFTMLDGDVQEVTVAIIGGLGANNIQSVADMKSTDDVAQTVYNSLFQVVPKPPEAPQVQTVALDDNIVLNWGSDPVAIKNTEEPVIINYEFEGYNVYQLASATSKITDPTTMRIATYDVINDVRIISSSLFSAEFGTVVEQPVQFGTDSGIKRYFTIDRDYISNQPLYRGSTYYFAVTAYNFDPNLVRDRALESSATVLAITPQDPNPGDRLYSEVGDGLDVSKAGAASDGVANVLVVDPTAVTGHDYLVEFEEDTDSTSATFGQIVWNLTDLTSGTVVGEKLPQSLTQAEDDQLIIDGLQIKISGPNPGVSSVSEIAYAGTALEAPDNVWHSLNSAATYFMSAGGGSGNYDRINRYAEYSTPRDFELRWTDGPNYGVSAFTTDNILSVPFELWATGIATPDDASDDVRMIPFIYENAPGNEFAYTGDVDPYFGGAYVASDWIYWMDPEGTDGYDNFAAACEGAGGAGNAYPYDTDGSTDGYWADFHGGFVYPIGRLIVCDYDLASAGGIVPSGTTVRLITNKPNQVGTTFNFTAPAAVLGNMDSAKVDVDKINVFPNPYYGDNPLEPSRFSSFVTFNHMPRNATLRIFNLGGSQVRKLEKEDDDNQFFRWDLLNERGLPVASGIYIVHIDMPDLGKTKVLKVVIVQPQQILEFF